ncbi:MAG: potassium transporter TrkG [Candidatus Eiseniibacteriota bacterium]|jgi:trk system potassium uptake protein TrkH
MRTARLIVASFAGAAVAGAVLLALPISTVGEPLGAIDCLFTATSAVCVTGLIVVDTAERFTAFGQGIIVVLIQLGGLGIMTLSTLFLLALGQKMGIGERMVVRTTLSQAHGRTPGELVREVVAVTLAFEGIGSLVLMPLLTLRHGESWIDAAGHAVFLSVSAFCNAGFAPWSDSLAGLRSDPWLIGTVTILIITGGIGFVVLVNLRAWLGPDQEGQRQNLSLHTRLVLSTTGVLLVTGTLLMLLLEWGGALAALSPGERLLGGFFQAVTPRTAGFTILDTPALSTPALFATMLLMLVGAGPGSTGGGLRVTTVAILWFMTRARQRGRARVEVFDRTLPEATGNRALATAFAGGVTVLAVTMALLLVERGGIHGQASQFMALVFEAVSSLCNVGLSMDVTGSLTIGGKLVVTLAMLIGRVGPLTVALAVAREVGVPRVRLAEEDVMVA